MKADVLHVLAGIDIRRLKDCVRKMEGYRHAWEDYDALEERARYIEDVFRSFGLAVESREVPFHGRYYRNIVATLQGGGSEEGMLLLGAHYDAAWGSRGADDNASGVAVLLEAARVLAPLKPDRTVQFAAFTLEEPQPQTLNFLIGSEHFAREARRQDRRYDAVIILESVGYTDKREGTQELPAFVGIPVPKTGDFLGVIANRRSVPLMKAFCRIAEEHVPGLTVVPYKAPFSGRFIPQARFSDHASFWNHRYPALMLTDTAMFRNPHYHTGGDRFETLDFTFMENVTRAVTGTIFELAMNEVLTGQTGQTG